MSLVSTDELRPARSSPLNSVKINLDFFAESVPMESE